MARRREMAPLPPSGEICVVLMRPRYAENIGAAVRAMENAGAGELRIVAPNEVTLEGIAQRVARGGAPRLCTARIFDSLQQAIADVDLAVATSHKTGKHRRPLTPWELSGQVLPALRPRTIALVFGPEDHGLSREEIDLCHRLVSVPSHGPLNLAQSVAVLLYELITRPRVAISESSGSGARVGQADRVPREAALPPCPSAAQEAGTGAPPQDPMEAPAPAAAVPRVVAAAERALGRIGYPHHRKPMSHEMARLADILARTPLRRWEMNFLIGMFRHIEHWADGHQT